MTKRNKFFWVLGVILMVAVFLRAWNFGDWMHYQLDQARDFRIISAAIEYGPGELPLQGPKAAGNVTIADSEGNLTDKTTLRLGPASYYFEYLSALIFGNTPAGSIVILLLVSIATVPLFYLFLRRQFAQNLALGLTALLAVSLFFVVYSRFGWNPNWMPFFILLLAYSLLRASDGGSKVSKSKIKNQGLESGDSDESGDSVGGNLRKSSGWWLVVAALALALVGQMHFLAFVSAPIIAVAYLIWTRPRIALRYWAMAVIVFSFVQIPLVINDVKTGGENSKAFMAALRGKTEAGEEKTHSLVEKLVRNIGNHTKYYWLINTGDQTAELPTLRKMDIRCDQSCRDGLIGGGVALAMIIVGMLAWLSLYRRTNNIKSKNFLRMVVLWYLVPFVLYIPLAYDMAPRFYLVHGLVNIILLGLVVQVIGRKSGNLRKIGVVVLGLFILSNLLFAAQYFHQLSRAATDSSLRIPTDRILKEKTRVTLAQMEQIIDYIKNIYQEAKQPIFVHAQAEFKRAFWERLDYYQIPRFHAAKDLSRAYRDGNYFLIVRTQSDMKKFAKILGNSKIAEKKVFGTMTVYRLQPKVENILDKNLTINTDSRDPKFSSNAQVRYLWRQIWE